MSWIEIDLKIVSIRWQEDLKMILIVIENVNADEVRSKCFFLV